jgi:hypothetical protein
VKDHIRPEQLLEAGLLNLDAVAVGREIPANTTSATYGMVKMR